MSDAIEKMRESKLRRYAAGLKRGAIRAKAASKATAEASMGTVLAGLGGAAAGLSNSKWPMIRGQNVITVATLVGGGTALLGLTGWAGDVSKQALDLGQGVLAGDVAIKTFLAAEKRRQNPKP